MYAYTLDTLQGGGNLEYDFDGDGKVNDKDGQAILDYVTGVRDSIQNAAHADLDGNGELTSRDAYLFLSQFRSGAFGAAPSRLPLKRGTT